MTGVAKVAGLAALMLGIARAVVSCIIADPPPEPPALPSQPPQIGTVSPPAPVFFQWPNEFAISILASTPYICGFYIDYTANYPANHTAVYSFSSEGNPDGGFAPLEVSLNPPGAGGCHTVYFVIQPNPGDLLGVGELAEPGMVPVGGAQVSWFYDPIGQGGCTNFDAGSYADAAFPPTMDGFTPPVVMDGSE